MQTNASCEFHNRAPVTGLSYLGWPDEIRHTWPPPQDSELRGRGETTEDCW